MKDKEKIQISGKQTKVGKSLTIYAKDNIFNTLKKYFSNFISADVLFSKDKFNFKCEINMHIDSSIFIKGNALSNDAYGAFNIANDKLKKRIRRYHRKLVDHRSKKDLKNIEINNYVIKDTDKSKIREEGEPVIISESEEIIKVLSVSEAMMLMNLNDQNAFFFKNIKTNRLNILFRRSDGNIGWLDPKK